MLAEPGIEPATSCSQVLYATDWATQSWPVMQYNHPLMASLWIHKIDSAQSAAKFLEIKLTKNQKKFDSDQPARTAQVDLNR